MKKKGTKVPFFYRSLFVNFSSMFREVYERRSEGSRLVYMTRRKNFQPRPWSECSL